MAVLEQTAAGQVVQEVPIEQVTAAPDNARRNLGELAELAISIKELGVRQPILARPLNGGYEVVAGARRLAAAQLAGLDTVPLLIRDVDERERLLVMAAENLQREDLTPSEEAEQYKRLLAELDVSQRELAGMVGKTQSHISKRLSLLDLPAKVREQVDAGGIKIEDGVELAKLAEHPDHLKAALEHSPWQTLESAVRNAQAEIKREAKLQRRMEELESQAIATIRVRGRYGLPKGVHTLKPQSSGAGVDYRALQITPKQHEKHSCHAIAITDQGDEFPVCTDRKNHPEIKTVQEADRAGQGNNKARPYKAPAEPPIVKKLRQARLRRSETSERLAAAKKPPKDAIALTLLHYLEYALDDAGEESPTRAAQWLGLIAPPADGGEEADEQHDAGDPGSVRLLIEHAHQGDTQLQRVAYALALAELDEWVLERYLRDGTPGTVGMFDGPPRLGPRRYLEHLRAQGHELDPLEAKALDTTPAAETSS